jgi:hypothetical protein
MSASRLRKLAALLCALVPLVPLAGLFAEQHHCACGMSKDACFCEVIAAQPGAHCDIKMKGSGKCSMRPLRTPSGTALLVSFDLRGWLQLRSLSEAGPVLAPAGAVPLADERAPRFFSRSPEPPPPRVFRSA